MTELVAPGVALVFIVLLYRAALAHLEDAKQHRREAREHELHLRALEREGKDNVDLVSLQRAVIELKTQVEALSAHAAFTGRR